MDNYEQKYKDALERAKKYYNERITLGHTRDAIKEIFLEFKESEDERIRKVLIDLVKCNERSGYKLLNNIPTSSMIAWLEKQGEQKSADKAEPKFHEGDWIVDNCSNVWKIEGIINQFYILEGIDGAESRPTIEWVNKTFHLWSIKDAKDGDVLVDVYGNIGIFEKRYGINWHTYCYLGNEGRLFLEGGSHGSICYLATKEQRELLFQKMKEAGYEWDDEKLELKKVEQWSEEDEKRAESLHGWLDTLVNYIHHDARVSLDLRRERMQQVEQVKTWLKSLKERICH